MMMTITCLGVSRCPYARSIVCSALSNAFRLPFSAAMARIFSTASFLRASTSRS